MLQTADPTVIQQLMEQYGLIGLAVGVLFTLILQQRKRISSLEEMQTTTNKENQQQYKEILSDYTELVKNQTQVLAQHTGCLKSLKDTMDRIDRKIG